MKYNDIVQIEISSSSGLTMAEFAYKDKLTISKDKIEYENLPFYESEQNPHQKWSYSTNNPEFSKLFDELAKSVYEIVHTNEMLIIFDAGDVTYTVTYTDNSREQQTFSLLNNCFDEFFSIIQKMIPPMEKIPNAIIMQYDEDEEDED